MNLFDTLRQAAATAVNTLVDLDDKTVNPVSAPATPTSAPTPSPSPSLSGSPAPLLTEVDPAFYQKFKAKVFQSADGPASRPFAAFVGVEQTLNSVVPDEAQRWRASLVMLKSQGVTASGVLADIQDLVRVVQKESETLYKALNDQRNSTLGHLQSEISALSDSIASKQREIDEMQAQKTKVVATVKSESEKLDALHDKFTNAAAQLSNELGSNVDKAKKYLGGSK